MLVSGCVITPSDGPSGTDVRAKSDVTVQDRGPNLAYALVKLSPSVIRLSHVEKRITALPQTVVGRASADIRLGVGDTVHVTIFESGAGGLFIPTQAGSRPGNFIQLPTQQVDKSGMISVPYAGQVSVVGKSVSRVQAEVEERLKNRAIEPQVIVSLGERRSSQISVLGDVNAPARFPLDPDGIRLMGAIARAGGPRFPAYETVITLQRGRQISQVELTTVVKHAAENVELIAGDVVFVSRQPKYFLAFGATGPFSSLVGSNNRRIPFEDANLTLAEGVAKAGGLQGEDRADPRSVFLYRQEHRDVLQRMGVDLTNFSSDEVPTIYMVDLKEPDGYFLANNFFMKNKDMVFVSDAPSVDVVKLMTVVNSVVSTGRQGVGLGRDINTFHR